MHYFCHSTQQFAGTYIVTLPNNLRVYTLSPLTMTEHTRFTEVLGYPALEVLFIPFYKTHWSYYEAIFLLDVSSIS